MLSGSVLQGLSDESINKMVVMDHADWMDPNEVHLSLLSYLVFGVLTGATRHPQLRPCPLDKEIAQMHRALMTDGAVYWRFAARRPW